MSVSKEYCIYNNMLQAYPEATIDEKLTFDCTAKQNEMLFFLATELAKIGAPNPIRINEPGFNEYEDLMFFYSMWPDNKPNCAFKKRFLYAAYKLCSLRPDNIFENQQVPEIEFSLEELQEEEYKQTEAEDIATETYVPVNNHKDVQKVMGVLPFEDDDEFFIEDYDNKEQEKPRGLFKRNKKRNKE